MAQLCSVLLLVMGGNALQLRPLLNSYANNAKKSTQDVKLRGAALSRRDVLAGVLLPFFASALVPNSATALEPDIPVYFGKSSIFFQTS
jgi:hypothetical protein